QKQFPDGDIAPVIAVFSRDGHTLSDEDMTSIASIGTRLGEHTGHDASQPIKSRDGEAAIVSIPMSQDQSDDAIAESIDQLRAIAHGDTPEGVDVQITGGPAFGADIAGAFDGANFTLLAVTIGIVAVVLLLTYRSPILWLVPMAVIGLADGLAGSVTGQLGQTISQKIDSGIHSVLVIRDGAKHAHLLSPRYQEDLRRHTRHRETLAQALARTAPAIVASNVTVVLSLLTLLLAVIPSTRGIGVASAVGLVIVLVFTLTALPALLAVTGRRIFWPFVPRAGQSVDPDRGFWAGLARRVTARAGLTIGVAIAGFAVLSLGLIGTP